MTTFLSIWHEVNHFTSFFKLYVFFLLSIPSSPTTHTLAAATKLPNANSTLQAGCVELYSTGIFLSLQKYSLSFPLSLSLSHTPPKHPEYSSFIFMQISWFLRFCAAPVCVALAAGLCGRLPQLTQYLWPAFSMAL